MVKLRETASAYIEAPIDTVYDILQDPGALPPSARDAPAGPLFATRGAVAAAEPPAEGDRDGERRVDVGGDAHRAWYILRREGGGTRVIHGAAVEPEGLVEQAVARVRWRDFHRTLEGELDAIKRLAESVDGADV